MMFIGSIDFSTSILACAMNCIFEKVVKSLDFLNVYSKIACFLRNITSSINGINNSTKTLLLQTFDQPKKFEGKHRNFDSLNLHLKEYFFLDFNFFRIFFCWKVNVRIKEEAVPCP